jgi:hypothetical protein
MGTRMFAKVMRIVAKWYSYPKSEEVFPQIFDDAVFAWKSGEFEGANVFLAEDPGGEVQASNTNVTRLDVEQVSQDTKTMTDSSPEELDVGAADMLQAAEAARPGYVSPRRASSLLRARLTRLLTVPTSQPSVAAASW